MSRMWKVGLVIAAVLALAGTAVAFVAAQTDGEGEPAPGEHPNFVGRLAENLGISQEELEQAIRQTAVDLVDEAVAEGRISEEKASKMRERIESGEGLFGGFGHGFRKGFAFGHGFGHLGAASDALADFLGISVDDLRAALADGQSLAQIGEAQGVSTEKLTAFLLGELEARLAEAVESGKITQERADEILAGAPERIDELINREGLSKAGPHKSGETGHGFPGKFRHGGFPGGFREGGFAQPVPEEVGPLF